MHIRLLILFAALPVLAYGATVERDAATSVVGDADAYLSTSIGAPSLSPNNNHTAAALTVAHAYAATTTLDVTVSLVAPSARFEFLDHASVLQPGEARTISIKDHDGTPGTYEQVVQVEATVLSGTSVGTVAYQRTLTIEVRA